MVDVETIRQTAIDGIAAAAGVGLQDRIVSKYLNPVLGKTLGKYTGVATGFISALLINYLGRQLGQEELARFAASGAFGFALFKALFGIKDPPEEPGALEEKPKEPERVPFEEVIR